MTEKQLAILLKVNANTTQGKAALKEISRLIDDLGDNAKTSSSGVNKSTKQVNKSLQTVQKQAKQTGTAQVMMGNMLARGLEAGARGVKDFTTESIDAFLAYEKELTEVAKTTGLPKEEASKLGDAFREIAAEIGPIEAMDVAKVGVVAGQLGIASEKIEVKKFAEARAELEGFSQIISEAAIALPEFSGGAEQLADTMAKQFNLYQVNTGAAETFLSTMNTAANTTAADAQQVATFLEGFTIAPQLGILQEQSVAMGATFVSLGQDANDASTRLQGAFQQVLVGSARTNGALETLFNQNAEAGAALEDMVGHSVQLIERNGVMVEDWSTLYREAVGQDAVGSMQFLIETLSDVDARHERVALSAKMFGRVGARVVNTLLGDYGELSDAGKAIAVSMLDTEEALTALEQTTGQTRETFSDTGEFIAAAFEEGPEAAALLIEAIQGIEDPAQRAQTAIAAFGEEAGQRIAEGGRTGLEMLQVNLDRMAQSAQEARDLNDGIASSIEQEVTVALGRQGVAFEELNSKITDVKIGVGEGLVPALADVAKSDINPLIDDMRKIVNESDAAKTVFEIVIPTAIGTMVDTGTVGWKALGAAATFAGDAYDSFADTTREAGEGNKAVVESLKEAEKNLKNVADATENYSEAVKDAGEGNKAMVASMLALDDSILATEDSLEGHSLTPAVHRYSEAVILAAADTGDFTGILQETEGSIFDMEGALGSLGASFGELSGVLGQAGDLFGFDASGAQGILDMAEGLSGIPDMLGDIKGSLGGVLGDLGSLFSGGFDLSNIVGSLGSLIPGIGSLLSMAGPLMDVLGGAWEGLKDLVGGLFEAKSEGTKAAEAFQDFVGKLEGGDKMASALKTNFDEMSAAAFDFGTYVQQSGVTMDQAFGGISENWQQGATAMDQFTIAVGQAVGNMDKAPQLALQMMGGFQDMGLSAEEAGLKMLEIAEASGATQAELEALRASLTGVQGQLSGAGEEGGLTTASLDHAKGSAGALKGEVDSLSGSLSTVQGQLSGAGAQGDSTRNIFDEFQASAGLLDQTTNNLSGSTSRLTTYLTDMGWNTMATGNMFDVAGASATGLQGDVNNLASEAQTATTHLDDIIKKLDEMPDEKVVHVRVEGGDVPGYAAGGHITQHMAPVIFNELGMEAARLPGGQMTLLTAPGPALGMFPVGTHIYPHTQVPDILRRYPNIQRRATGGPVEAVGGSVVVQVDIHDCVFQKEMDVRQVVQSAIQQSANKLSARRRRSR